MGQKAASGTVAAAIPRTDDAENTCAATGSNVMTTMGTITVYREYGIPLVGRLKVFVDGVHVTGLRSNSSVDITAGSGRHTVRVGMAWQASAPVDVELEDGGRVTLRARVDLRAQSFTAFFLRPNEALDLDVVPSRPQIPVEHTKHVVIPRD